MLVGAYLFEAMMNKFNMFKGYLLACEVVAIHYIFTTEVVFNSSPLNNLQQMSHLKEGRIWSIQASWNSSSNFSQKGE